MKEIFVIVLHFGALENTLVCLQTLQKCKIPKNARVSRIVINNGMPKEDSIKIREAYKNVIVLPNNKNLGFSAGMNSGIKYALGNKATHIIILNNDTYVDSMFVAQLFNTSESDKEIGIVAPKIYFAKGFEFHKNRYKKEDLGKVIWYAGGIMDWKNCLGFHKGVDEVDMGQFGKKEKTQFASGCCMLIKRKVIEKIGMLNEKYFLYYEDNEFSTKAQRAGFDIIFEPKGIIWHKNAGASGGSGSTLQDYFITRNRLLFGISLAPFRTKIALIKESIRLLISGRQWQKRGVIDFYNHKFGKGSYAIK